MAYFTHDVRFLFSCLKRGASFKRTLVIGRSLVWVTPQELLDAALEFDLKMDLAEAERILTENKGYCEPLYKFMGAEEIKALDYSDYEGAQIIQDLNKPLSPSITERFTAVIDGGSTEHVFNIVEAVKTVIELVAEGGSFMTLAPSNNLSGHGFYQFSPEFLYAVLSPENGYKVKRMLLHENKKHAEIYEVQSPQEFGDRIMLCNRNPTFIKAWGVREKVKPLFETYPQQPDWTPIWTHAEVADQGPSLKEKLKTIAQKSAPKLLEEYQRIRLESGLETGFKLSYYKKASM